MKEEKENFMREDAFMRKTVSVLFTCLCAAFLALAGPVSEAAAAPSLLEPVRIWGPVTKEADSEASQNAHTLTMDNQSGQSYDGEIRLNITDIYTRILDAQTGMPVAFSDIEDGSVVYAYIGPAMTMSLPPMANASLILCNIPADGQVPDYVKIESVSWNTGRTQATVKAADGSTYTVWADCQVLPYLTRNIVTVDDLDAGRSCLIWTGEDGQASRILLFPGESDDAAVRTGWQSIDGSWYYYNDDSSLATGWILVDGLWYYMDPATGIMQTGFLTLDGKTYYLQEDGSMLTEPKVFTPDESGALH